MSLIIARPIGPKIFLIADTKLTDSGRLPDPSRLNRAQMVSEPRDGVIKITILNPQLVVAFAGEVDTADDPVKACRTLRPDQIINLLKETNEKSGGRTDFIVAIGYPINQVVEIKDEKISFGVEHSWLGSNYKSLSVVLRQ